MDSPQKLQTPQKKKGTPHPSKTKKTTPVSSDKKEPVSGTASPLPSPAPSPHNEPPQRIVPKTIQRLKEENKLVSPRRPSFNASPVKTPQKKTSSSSASSTAPHRSFEELFKASKEIVGSYGRNHAISLKNEMSYKVPEATGKPKVPAEWLVSEVPQEVMPLDWDSAPIPESWKRNVKHDEKSTPQKKESTSSKSPTTPRPNPFIKTEEEWNALPEQSDEEGGGYVGIEDDDTDDD